MALSVRLEPELEERVEQEAQRLGKSRSEFVKDALERTLGIKNPAKLLVKARTGIPSDNLYLSKFVKEGVRRKLRTKHSG